MKPSVAISLIIMGALVIMTPPVSDYFHAREVAKILASEVHTSVSLGGGMGEIYRFGCWAAGLLMISFAVFGSIQRKSGSKKDDSTN